MWNEDRQRTFETLLAAHRRIVLKVAAVYARGVEDRKDLGQEISLQLWRSFGSYDPARPFSTWMYRVALNVGLSHARRQRERTQPLDASLIDTLGGGAAIEEPDERLRALSDAIEVLEPLDRALMLLYLEELPYADIAAVLGISDTNVGTRIARLKQRLRRDLTGEASQRRRKVWNSTN